MNNSDDDINKDGFSDFIGTENASEQIRIPVIEEHLQISKTWEETGKVRISKSVTREEETIDFTLLKQEALIERVSVNKIIEGVTPEVRTEGDIMVIPVIKEVLVVEKRLMLVEEIRVTRQTSETNQHETHELLTEHVSVDRISEGLVNDNQ